MASTAETSRGGLSRDYGAFAYPTFSAAVMSGFIISNLDLAVSSDPKLSNRLDSLQSWSGSGWPHLSPLLRLGRHGEAGRWKVQMP